MVDEQPPAGVGWRTEAYLIDASTIITRGSDGAVQFSAKVPGRVPGSYATYDKVVDASGTTIGYTKTTVLPDGTVLHTKDKLNP